MAAQSAVPDIAGMLATTQRHEGLSTSAEALEAVHALVDGLGPAMSETPTSIYDSPSWPGELDRAAAAADPSLDVQQQIEMQAELQRQLDAQLEEAQTRERAAAEKAAVLERVQRSAIEVVRPPPEGQSGVHRAPSFAAPPSGPKSSGQTTVVTTVGPPPKRPAGNEQPSIVIAMDLEPGEPTVVSANMPGLKERDVMRTLEVSPVTDKARSGGGFGDGQAHESLIIDFDGDSDGQSSAPGPEPAGGPPDKNIRPAAQPLGKRVPPTAAQPGKQQRPAPRATSADENPGNTMPPPTRRRS